MNDPTPISLELSRREALAVRDLIAECLRMGEASAPAAVAFHGRDAYGPLTQRLYEALIEESMT
ncbi:MAG: hypothetical protein OXH37_01430 [Gammaproteobacteria bacterium]|nr:hypothetical protein [Gammaproteobacteria bacterium]